MPFTESVSVALFIITIVFLVLCGLFLFMRLISFALKKTVNPREAEPPAPEPLSTPRAAGGVPSSEVCLNNVDDKTAAMLMAIVADESGIPLSELRFTSLKQLPSDPSED